MTTLSEALTQARLYWDTKRGNTGEVMAMRAKVCVDLLSGTRSLPSLKPADAIHVLGGLQRRGLSASCQASYYAAFRRMLALNGVLTTGWPKGPSPPRRKARPLEDAHLEALQGWLAERGWGETVDLLVLLKGAGLRVDVEALAWDALCLHAGNLLEVTGKGGHTRLIPVGPEVAELVKDTPRLVAVRRLSYDGHLKRWNLARKALGLPKEATPHAVRHWYASKAYTRSGKDLRAVQELLGHADVSTTAGYVGTSQDSLREAAGV